MTKIKNTEAYPYKIPVPSDFVTGSDSENDGKTVSYKLQDIVGLINSENGIEVVSYIFAESPIGELDENGSGYFLSENNETDPENITKLIVSKNIKTGIDLSILFNFIEENKDSFILKLRNISNPNNFIYFKITNITEQTYQFIFEVIEYQEEFFEGVLVENNTYTFDFDLKAGNSPENYSKIVYVNAVSPTIATIFDTHNPPITNDDLLKNDVNNLYIGNDASTWVYITSPSGYITKDITISASNFYLEGTLIDAGINKNGPITRSGTVGGAPAILPGHFVTKSQLDTLIVTDATTTAKGIVKLAGDLGGTADLPTVPGLSGKQSTLVSGTNIKTVGGISLLGSGNVTEVQNNLIASTTLAPSATTINESTVYKRTISQIRALSGALPNNYFYTTDIGQEGNWYYDASDTVTADNLGTVLVTSDGKRIKRFLSNSINVKWFGAKGDGTTSDPAAIQNTINYVFSTNGGTIYFPNGTYIVDNALITSLDSVNPNCQLYIPLTAQSNVANSVVIKFLGETPPNFNTSGLATWPKSHDGVILSSTITGSGTNPAVIGSSYSSGVFGNWNYTQLYVQNVTIRVKSKSGAAYIAPTVGGVNAENIGTVSFEDVHIDTSGDNFNSVIPSTDVTGIFMPKIGNNAWSYLNRVSVEGFNKGIRVNEHTNGTNIAIWCCVNGLQIESSDHLSSFDRILIAWCNNNVFVPTGLTKAPTLKINNLAIEDYNNSFGAKWYLSSYDISDTGNQLKGEISFVKVISNVGAVTGALVINGATNVSKINLYSGLGSGDPTAKKKVFGSTASISTGPGLDGTNCAIRELNSNTVVSNDEGFGDLVFTHNQNGTNNAVGRIPFLNLQSTISDKRVAQIYVSTFGSKNIGKMFVMANNGTSLQTVLEIESELFKLNKITKYASDLSASYDARTLTDKAYVDKNRLTSYTVATLPAGTVGDTAFVTDATAPTYLGVLIGGGSVRCPVFYNGTSWVSH